MIESTRGLIDRLANIFPLNATERQALGSLRFTARTFSPHEDIEWEGEQPSSCCLIVEGWVYRYRALWQGARQILAIYIPGDLPDLESLHLGVLDNSLAALTHVTVNFVRHGQLHALIEEHPRLGSAFWKETLIDAAISREWIVGMGSKPALPRIARLFCELFVRMRAAGRAAHLTCDFPMTQQDLGDALGMTPVHTNRMLQKMRHQQLIVLEKRTLTILDWPRLKAIAEFDATYLHRSAEVELSPTAH